MLSAGPHRVNGRKDLETQMHWEKKRKQKKGKSDRSQRRKEGKRKKVMLGILKEHVDMGI